MIRIYWINVLSSYPLVSFSRFPFLSESQFFRFHTSHFQGSVSSCINNWYNKDPIERQQQAADEQKINFPSFTFFRIACNPTSPGTQLGSKSVGVMLKWLLSSLESQGRVKKVEGNQEASRLSSFLTLQCSLAAQTLNLPSSMGPVGGRLISLWTSNDQIQILGAITLKNIEERQQSHIRKLLITQKTIKSILNEMFY